MKFLKTFLIVLITSVLAFAKTGYASSLDSNQDNSSTHLALNLSTFGEDSHHQSLKQGHPQHGNLLVEIDLQEDEEEDSKEKKRSTYSSTSSIRLEERSDFTPSCLGCTSEFIGIAATQSIRLHLIIEKFQI